MIPPGVTRGLFAWNASADFRYHGSDSTSEERLAIRTTGALILTAITVLAACGDGFDLPEPAQIEKENGDGQSATAGNRLAVPFSVAVTAEDGSEVPREQVRWSVIEGSGAELSDTVTVTDGTGLAHVYLTLGPSAGTYNVRALLVRKTDAAVTFEADAVSAPTIDVVTPPTFTGGERLVIQGTHLTDSTVVEFNGSPGEIAAPSPTGNTLAVFAPNCLVPGPVAISVRVGISPPSVVTGAFVGSGNDLLLDAGEYLSAKPGAIADCATFPSAGPSGAEYLLAPQLVSGVPGETVWFRLMGDAASATFPVTKTVAGARPITNRFDDHLRGFEAELAQRPRQPLSAREIAAAPVLLDIEIGDRRNFRVCDKVTCSQEADFAEVTAEVKYVGDRALIYQDIDAPVGGLAAQDFQELGSVFDRELYRVATRAFGSESDLDRNGHVLILFTPIVNGMTETSQCSQSFITGFFFPLDIDPMAEGDNRSNQAELFYAIVPDPNGTLTCDHTVARVTRIVPVTFIHELQHMINFHQHVVVRAGNSEVTWLNESMSHMAEELAALHFEALGQTDRFTAFSLGDLYNSYTYLRDPASYYLLYSEGTGTLEERGAGWLFLRWLVDQFGLNVLRRLSETDLTSTENVVAATGEPMSKLLSDWFLANYVSDHPDINEIPDRLRYKTWNFRETYASLHSQDRSLFDRPFPIVPPEFNGGIFDVSATVGGGSGAYFSVVQGGGQAGFTVQLVDSEGDPLEEEAARLNVIRIR